jgi:hypothetical protein
MIVVAKIVFLSVFLSCLLFLSILVPYGTAITGWIKTYGELARSEEANSVIQTDDGGYALLGSAGDSYGWSDACLIKTDSSGIMQWSRTYGGPNSDGGNSFIQTSDGGFVVAGTRNEWSQNGSDVWLFKTDASGDMLWEQTYSGSAKDRAEDGFCVVQTVDGGYAVLGVLYWETGGPALIKTDASGILLWNRTIDRGSEFRSLIQTGDEGFALAGSKSNEFYLVKTDSSGNIEWNQTYSEGYGDRAFSIIQTADGGYALAGCRGGTGSLVDERHQDFMLVKTDSVGNEEWLRTYGVIDYEIAYSVVQTKDGGYIMAGTVLVEDDSKLENPEDYNSNWVVKTDASGNVEWSRVYGSPDMWEMAHSVIQTSDNGYAVAGYIKAQNSDVPSDFWLVKIDEYGLVPEFPLFLLLSLLVTSASLIALVSRGRYRTRIPARASAGHC